MTPDVAGYCTVTYIPLSNHHLLAIVLTRTSAGFRVVPRQGGAACTTLYLFNSAIIVDIEQQFYLRCDGDANRHNTDNNSSTAVRHLRVATDGVRARCTGRSFDTRSHILLCLYIIPAMVLWNYCSKRRALELYRERAIVETVTAPRIIVLLLRGHGGS